MKFTDFGFNERLMEGIEASRYQQPTPIQQQVTPLILNGKDVLTFAQTGTGKTAAFLLPLIHRLITDSSQPDGIKALIIVPTRELAMQTAQHLDGLSYFTGVSSVTVYGGGNGNDFVQEKKALSMGVEVVICTPGKMMAHIKMGYVKFENLQYLVLDEADRMLDMGFYSDIMFIVNRLPKKRQNLLFSATMPPEIKRMAQTILQNPVEVSIAMSKPPEKIVQQAYLVYDEQKIPLIQYLLAEKKYKAVLIFCSSKHAVKQLTRDLRRKGINAGEIHSDLEQEHREDVLISYKSGRLPVLVATDILSRGIDIDKIELIINFDVPRAGEDYVHRIGRTARAEATGSAFTLVNGRDQRRFGAIEKLLGRSIDKISIPKHLGNQPVYNPTERNSVSKKRYFKNKGRRPQ